MQTSCKKIRPEFESQLCQATTQRSFSKLYQSPPPHAKFPRLQKRRRGGGGYSYLTGTRRIECKSSVSVVILGSDESRVASQSSVRLDAGLWFLSFLSFSLWHHKPHYLNEVCDLEN